MDQGVGSTPLLYGFYLTIFDKSNDIYGNNDA